MRKASYGVGNANVSDHRLIMHRKLTFPAGEPMCQAERKAINRMVKLSITIESLEFAKSDTHLF